MTNEEFAAHLGIAVRTVASWHQKPTMRQKPVLQQVLDTTLEQASPPVKARFAQLVADDTEAPSDVTGTGTSPQVNAAQERVAADAEQRLDTDPNIGKALYWLDEHAGRPAGTSRQEVAARLARLNMRELHERSSRRARIDQRRIAQAMAEYYGDRVGHHGRYSARFGDEAEIETSIITCADWLDLGCPLIAANDRLRPAIAAQDTAESLDSESADRAAQRLAETLALGIRLVDMPLYRLLEIDFAKGVIAGSVGVSRFAEYAVTMDLLEGELIDALAIGSSVFPLRDRYLPDLASVLDLSGRLCAGGPLALCAIGRPADLYRGPADYLLLVQERSGHVINAARRLAVIPKGFHQPLTDVRADAQIGATLRREMDEELFGRDDIDNTISDQRSADPMHPSRLSEPMRWLMAEPGRLKMECTGFGLNLVSGNFEFPGLIVIDDEDFWAAYGGQIEANWESEGLRQYSSLDPDVLADLVRDVAWSNEGLFALMQGLRRLEQIDGYRVNLPAIEWEVR